MSNTNIYDKSFPVSWEEIHRNSKALAWRLSELKPYKGINACFRDRSFSKLLEYYFGKKNLVFLTMELPGYHSSRVF